MRSIALAFCFAPPFEPKTGSHFPAGDLAFRCFGETNPTCFGTLTWPGAYLLTEQRRLFGDQHAIPLRASSGMRGLVYMNRLLFQDTEDVTALVDPFARPVAIGLGQACEALSGLGAIPGSRVVDAVGRLDLWPRCAPFHRRASDQVSIIVAWAMPRRRNELRPCGDMV